MLSNGQCYICPMRGKWFSHFVLVIVQFNIKENKISSMAVVAEREMLSQLQALNAFLAKLTALDSRDKRFDRYNQVSQKLVQRWKTEVNFERRSEAGTVGDLGGLVQQIAHLNIDYIQAYEFHLSKTVPIEHGQDDFFKAFSLFVEKDLREVVVNRSCRRHCPPNSKWYNTQLIERIDAYLSSLDKYIDLKEDADHAHAEGQSLVGVDQAGAEQYELEERGIRKEITEVELQMNNEFLEVILFVFAVPQEKPLPARYRKFHGVRLRPPLEEAEVNLNVKWMHDDCVWYQANPKFMEFLVDYAVIALMRSYYEYSESFLEICRFYEGLVADYKKTDAFAEIVNVKEVSDDSVSKITHMVRKDSHGRRRGAYEEHPNFDATRSKIASTRANLAALNNIYMD